MAADDVSQVIARYGARAHRHARRVSRKIVAVAAVLATCMWLFIIGSLWSEREQALAHGRTEGHNLAAAFAEEITHTFDTISGVLDLMAARAKDDPAAFHPGDALRQWTDELPRLAREGAHVSVVDADGRMIFTTFRPDPGPVDISFQPHFAAVRDNPGTDLYIGRPLSGKVSTSQMIHVARRLVGPDGSFIGAALFILAPGQLTNLHRTMNLGRRGAIAVIGTDGIVRGRFSQDHPDGLLGIGVDVRTGPWPASLPPGGQASYIRVGVLDPVERLYNIRRLERYPLIVNVALDLDDVLGPWRAHAWLIAAVGVGASGLMAVLTALLIREIRRRTGREIELQTEREQLRIAQAQIARDRTELAEAHQALIVSKDQAEAANRAKSQFLAHMSHELRTPLHAILGFSELIVQQSPRTTPRLTDYANDILASGRHLLELINAILDISKVESGTERLVDTTVAVSDVIRASLVAVRSQAEQGNVTLEQRLSNDLPRIVVDTTRMRQVMINLLSNAVKFTPRDGRVIIAACTSGDGEVLISVSDNGIGMTEAEIGIALQPFGQVDSSLARTFQGTGLGLPLAVRLVELHGGRLVINSTKGAGTTAEIFIPAARVVRTASAMA